MKKLRYLILLIGLLTATQAAQAIVVTIHLTYFEKGGDVYWGQESDLRYAYKLHQASMSSLEILEGAYAKNRRWVYFQGKIVDGADPESFQSLTNGYAKDRSRVYYYGKLVKGAHRKTFDVVNVDKNYAYGKDKSCIFFDDVKTAFDVNTFTYIDKNYIADSSGIYYHHSYRWSDFYGKIEKIEGANPTDYKIIDDFLLSASRVYLGNEDLNIDASSFELLDKYEYGTHGRHYVYDYLVKDSSSVFLAKLKRYFDFDTFRPLARFLLCDSTGVYYYNMHDYNNKLRKLDLEPSTVESYASGTGYSCRIVVKDSEKGYFINPEYDVFNRIRLEDITQLKPVKETESGYIFSYQDQLLIIKDYGLEPYKKQL